MRNLGLAGALSDVGFLICDRDSKFVAAFDEVFRTEGVEVIRSPCRSPQADAYAERFVRTARAECLELVDNERYVVADDLDDGVRRPPAVLLELRVVNAHLRLAGARWCMKFQCARAAP